MSNKFSFFKPDELVARTGDFVAYVPSNLITREELFDALQKALSLPAYFGHNWDALVECLHDLNWIIEHRVLIIHHETPNLPFDQLETYEDVLTSSSRYWQSRSDHKLLIAMP